MKIIEIRYRWYEAEGDETKLWINEFMRWLKWNEVLRNEMKWWEMKWSRVRGWVKKIR